MFSPSIHFNVFLVETDSNEGHELQLKGNAVIDSKYTREPTMDIGSDRGPAVGPGERIPSELVLRV